MTEFEIALLIIQALGALLVGALAWHFQRQVARIAAHDARQSGYAERDAVEALATRVTATESNLAVFDVRLQGAASEAAIRTVMREELDRALESVRAEQKRMSRRLERLEERTD